MERTYTINKGSAKYAQIEKLVTHIADDNKLDNIKQVVIMLSPESGMISFKEASMSYDSMTLEQSNGFIVHKVEDFDDNMTKNPAVKIDIPGEYKEQLSQQGKYIRVEDMMFNSAKEPNFGLVVFVKDAENKPSLIPGMSQDKSSQKDITDQCKFELVQ